MKTECFSRDHEQGKKARSNFFSATLYPRPSWCNKQKTVNRYSYGKGNIKLSLITDVAIIYVENPRESIKKNNKQTQPYKN